MKAKESTSKKGANNRASRKKKQAKKEALIAAANEATMRAWKHTYATRDDFGKFE